MAYIVKNIGDKEFILIKNKNSEENGVEISNDAGLNAKAILEQAGLNWGVEKIPLSVDLSKFGKGVEKVGQSALIRADNGHVFDVVSDDWNPVQNIDAFETFCKIANASGMKLDRASAFKDGAYPWAQARINIEFEIVKGDNIINFLMLSSPHVYGKSFQLGYCQTRVVCWNTFVQALSSEYMVRMHHRYEYNETVILEMVKKVRESLFTFKEHGAFLASKKLDSDRFEEFLLKLFPAQGKEKILSRPAHIVKSIMDTQPGAEFGQGTWWQAFNAVTFFTDHLAGRSNDNRNFNAYFGNGVKLKQKAMDEALKLAA